MLASVPPVYVVAEGALVLPDVKLYPSAGGEPGTQPPALGIVNISNILSLSQQALR